MENVTRFLYDFAALHPEKPALLHPVRITFGELCRLTDAYAAGFAGSGISKGTRTVVLIKPGADLFAVVFALLRIGAIPVLIDPGMGIKAMVRALSTVKAGAFAGMTKAHWLRLLFPHALKTIRVAVSTGIPLFPRDGSLKKFRKSGNTSYTLSQSAPDDEVAVFFTSGSTGPAKAVVYRNAMVEAQMHYLRDHFRYAPNDIDLCTFPLIGLLVINLGLSVVMADMDMTHPATLKPSKLLTNIRQYGCTTMFCSPMVLKKLSRYAHARKLKIDSLQKVFTAGAPVPSGLLRDFKKLVPPGAVIHTPFGSTEALSVTDATDAELWQAYGDRDSSLQGTCIGRPLDGIRLRLIPVSDDAIENMEDVKEVTPGEVGEITVYGPNVTQNYLNNDAANRLSKIREGHLPFLWHRTGDLGRIDSAGRLWYCGRKSQRVITPTRVYFTIPCEAVFNRHPAVERSALVGIRIPASWEHTAVGNAGIPSGMKKKIAANGPPNTGITPVICIELKPGFKESELLRNELLALARETEVTSGIDLILFHKKFPVDPRHNAKIFREKLAVWAQKSTKK